MPPQSLATGHAPSPCDEGSVHGAAEGPVGEGVGVSRCWRWNLGFSPEGGKPQRREGHMHRLTVPGDDSGGSGP